MNIEYNGKVSSKNYKRLQPLTVLSGTVYRLTSSPVLYFNVFEDCNEESVIPHVSFVSFV